MFRANTRKMRILLLHRVQLLLWAGDAGWLRVLCGPCALLVPRYALRHVSGYSFAAGHAWQSVAGVPFHIVSKRSSVASGVAKCVSLPTALQSAAPSRKYSSRPARVRGVLSALKYQR